MARVLISEPHPDCRALLELVVQRAGHDPIGQGELAGDDDLALLILEPASAEGLAIAHRLRHRLEDLPIICTSVKPFRLSELDVAMASVLERAAA